MPILNLTAANFDEITAKHELIVLDFWAPWCNPCTAFGKVCEVVASKFPNVIFGKINIDEEKTLAEEFNVRSIPWVILIRQQVALYADSGALTESNLTELIQKAQAIDDQTLQQARTE